MLRTFIVSDTCDWPSKPAPMVCVGTADMCRDFIANKVRLLNHDPGHYVTTPAYPNETGYEPRFDVYLEPVSGGEYAIEVFRNGKLCALDMWEDTALLHPHWSLNDDDNRVRDDGGVTTLPGVPGGLGSFVAAAHALGIRVWLGERLLTT